jgi:FkbM family methyltransferase
MAQTLRHLLRRFVPNVTLRIPHVETHASLEVRLGQHLGLVLRGAKGYEAKYVDVLRSLIREGDTVFDVGANIGFYTVLFSRWVGVKGKVIAYEPDPSNVDLLKRNLLINKSQNTITRELALGNHVGKDRFSVDYATGATGHIGEGPTYGEVIFGRGRESLITVDINTLDVEVERWGTPNLIKLDIEGSEFDVLSGGLRLLECRAPIIISELNAWGTTDGVLRVSLATQLLRDHGYSLWNLDTGVPVKASETGWMILAIPESRIKETRITAVLNRFENNQ